MRRIEFAAPLCARLCGVAIAPPMPSPEYDSVREHPVSHGQRALWFLHHMDPSNPAYNVHFVARIHSTVDGSAMHHTFQRLVDRHAPLRSTFHLVEDRIVQRVSERLAVHFDAQTLAGATPEDVKDRLVQLASAPFDLERGPVFRVTLIQRAADEHYLLVNAHHIVTDMWSCVVLMEEMAAVYAAEAAGVAIDLPSLPIEYADYVQWQSRMLSSSEGERQWTHWKEALAGDLPTLDLATDHARPAVE